MEIDLNNDNLVKKTFLVAFFFTAYAFYYDFYMAKMPLTILNIAVKLIFVFLPIINIYFFKFMPMYWRMFLSIVLYIIYTAYYTYNLSLAYLSTGIQVSFVFTILLIFELREFLFLSITNFLATLIAGIYSPNIYSLSQFGEVKKAEDIENFISLYLMTMIAYALVTYPRLKKMKEDYRFSKIGKATSFILHEISKPIMSLDKNENLSSSHIEDLKNKLEIARQLQNGIVENVNEKILVKDILNKIIEEKSHFLNFFEIKIETKVDSSVWFADPKLIYTVMSNIIVNAIEATSKVDQVESRIIKIELKESDLIISNPFQSTIPEKDIFSPMKSTKPGNMGMGLYISKMLTDSQKFLLLAKVNKSNFVINIKPS